MGFDSQLWASEAIHTAKEIFFPKDGRLDLDKIKPLGGFAIWYDVLYYVETGYYQGVPSVDFDEETLNYFNELYEEARTIIQSSVEFAWELYAEYVEDIYRECLLFDSEEHLQEYLQKHLQELVKLSSLIVRHYPQDFIN